MIKSEPKKLLAGVAGWTGPGNSIGIFPGVRPDKAAEAVARFISGSSTRSHHCAVLWTGTVVSLLYVQGSHDKKNGTYAPRVWLVAPGTSRDGRAFRQEVWVGAATPDLTDLKSFRRDMERKTLWGHGRITKAVIATLIDRAREANGTFHKDREAEVKAEQRKREISSEQAEAYAAELRAREIAKEHETAKKVIQLLRGNNAEENDPLYGNLVERVAAIIREGAKE